MTYKIQYLDMLDNDVDIWGGKATALFKLIQSGVTVPKGVVISSECYELYMAGKLNVDLFEQNFREIYENCFLETDNNLIFRSSANVEGNGDFPCCGVFDSYLYDSSCSFFENVRKVWESVRYQQSLDYYQSTGLSIENIKMAVIVQEVHKGTYNAVIQSYDTINDSRRIILELTKGAINSIVDDYEDSLIIYVNSDSENSVEQAVINEDINQNTIEMIRRDCHCIEKTFGSHVEIEAQIFENHIIYLQARKI